MHSLSQALTFDIWVWQNIYRLCTVLSFLNYFQDTFNIKWIRHPHFFRQVCLHRVFQEPVWINTDLSSKRQDSLCMSWCFIRTRIKPDEHQEALNTYFIQCVFIHTRSGGQSRAEKEIPYMDKSSSYRCMQTEKQKLLETWRHWICNCDNIWFICVFQVISM